MLWALFHWLQKSNILLQKARVYIQEIWAFVQLPTKNQKDS